MGLFENLEKTTLKTYKYKENEKPYITHSPPENSSASDSLGIVQSISAATDDVVRISKFMTDPVKGPLFIAKQIGLQLSNPKLETKNVFNDSTFIGSAINSLRNELGSTRIYNGGINTLTQIPLNIIGEHITRHGLSPIDNYSYEETVKYNNENNGNRLVGLYNKFYIPSSKIPFISNVLNTQDSAIISDYNGGPNSLYGVGRTKIYRADSAFSLEEGILQSLQTAKTKVNTIKLKDVSALTPISQLNLREEKISSHNIDVEYEVQMRNTGGIPEIQMRKHVFSSSSTSVNSMKYQFTTGSNEVTPINNNQGIGFNNGKLTQFDRNDSELMSIVIELIDPFTGLTMNVLSFPAYLEDYDDNINSSSTDIDYVGKSQTLVKGNKWKRNGRLTINIPAANPVELNSYHRQVGSLMSSQTGMYKNNKLGHILHKLYFGSYLKGELIFIDSSSLRIKEGSSWDIDRKLAHILTLSINYTIIHNSNHQYSEGGFFSHVEKNYRNVMGSLKALESSGYKKADSLKLDIPLRT